MDVTEDNADELSQHAAAEYLAEIEWGLSSLLSLPQGKKHRYLDINFTPRQGIPRFVWILEKMAEISELVR